MNKLIILGCCFIFVFLNSGCKYENEETLYGVCDTTNATYDKVVKPILVGNCTSCHNASNPGGGYNLSSYQDDVDGNLGVQSSALNGGLYGTISYDPNHSPMPKGKSKLDDCSINKVKAWVDRGALNN
ncbi:MAG: hypothetical protein ACKOX3_09560 [Bacteroidota bacterium]